MPASAAVVIPTELPFDVACLIGCGVATGVGAVDQHGAGEGGLVRRRDRLRRRRPGGDPRRGPGRRDPIIAIDREEAKLELAREAGATHVIQPAGSVRRAVRAIVPGFVDYTFEAIGLKETIELMPRLTRRGGTMVMVGMTPRRRRSRSTACVFPSSGMQLLGSSYGSSVPAVEFPLLARLNLAGKLPIERMVTHRIALDEVNDALGAMRQARARPQRHRLLARFRSPAILWL